MEYSKTETKVLFVMQREQLIITKKQDEPILSVHICG